MIAIIDYDIGNLAAVANMLQRLGAECVITADPDRVAAADRIVLPGNGHFDACMRNLRTSGLVPLLEQRVIGDRVPLLGICVGAQMLGRGSEEGTELGLGWLPMSVKRFPDFPGLRVPHMGWNQAAPVREGHALTRDFDQETRFYFVHSYYMQPDHEDDVMLRCQYGLSFAAGVARGNIAGVQFHPEKSHRYGKRLLNNFVHGA
ncbi:MAG: imidazole glycerol phosphate synthase subunit HisH [Burkholderiales bacterium]|nr:imidazole glycerol phosphate synthase subunit HisH [Burkholderiales bacterium]